MARHLPSLNALRVFEAAARQNSFKRAAKELYATPSAVSRQIRNLENQLGVRLFERHNRRIRLTEIGEAYVPTLSRAFDDIAASTERISPRPAATQKPSRLVIATETSVAECWLRPRLSRFRRAHPHVEIEVLLTNSGLPRPPRQADIVIHYGPDNWSGLHQEKLMPLTEFPVCSPDLLTGRRPLRHPEDLARCTLLHEDTTRWWALWLKGAGLTGVDPGAGPILHNSALCLDGAIAGEGVAMGDELVAGDNLLVGKLVKPFGYCRPADASLYLFISPDMLDVEEVKTFATWLRCETRRFADRCKRFGGQEPYPRSLDPG